jgi:hypothetical protein
VAKERISRQDLQRMALQEMRAYPGAEHVTDLEIEYQANKAGSPNWVMHVFTREGANMERIQHAINVTRHRLQHRYDLRTES